MNFYIGVTDKDWFRNLSSIQADEVNFWQPSGRAGFKTLKVGEPFLFKLKHPINAVVGGGFFVRHSFLPIDLAWEAFGEKNGSEDFESFANKIYSYRARNNDYNVNPVIGCIILTNCFYFDENQWLAQPKSFSTNLTQGKTYRVNEPDYSFWNEVERRINWSESPSITNEDALKIGEDQPRYAHRQGRYRLGQGGFRISVIEAYQRRCAITGEKTLPVLEAAHIMPYQKNGPHKVENGLLLRSDIHKLFDKGYLTVTMDYKIEVSSAIKEEFSNGREYYAYHGKELHTLPQNAVEQPSKEFIEWHNGNVFKK